MFSAAYEAETSLDGTTITFSGASDCITIIVFFFFEPALHSINVNDATCPTTLAQIDLLCQTFDNCLISRNGTRAAFYISGFGKPSVAICQLTALS